MKIEKLNYKDEFMLALKRTGDWGLDVPDFEYSNNFVTSEDNLKILSNTLQDCLGDKPYSELSGQCFGFNLLIKEQLEIKLKMKLYYTLGYIFYEGRNVFYSEEQELKKLIKTQIQPGSVNLHAWLTSSNYEIIDITFPTTEAFATNNEKLKGMVIAKHYDKLTKDLTYHPQLIGHSYLYKIGALFDFEYLTFE